MRKKNLLKFLEPGKTQSYEVTIQMLNEETEN